MQIAITSLMMKLVSLMCFFSQMMFCGSDASESSISSSNMVFFSKLIKFFYPILMCIPWFLPNSVLKVIKALTMENKSFSGSYSISLLISLSTSCADYHLCFANFLPLFWRSAMRSPWSKANLMEAIERWYYFSSIVAIFLKVQRSLSWCLSYSLSFYIRSSVKNSNSSSNFFFKAILNPKAGLPSYSYSNVILPLRPRRCSFFL